MNCLECGSPNCKSLEMIHQDGSFTSSSIELIGGVRTQTDLAYQCRPPSNYFRSIGLFLSLFLGTLAFPAGCTATAMKGVHAPANLGFGLLAAIVTASILAFIVNSLSRALGFTGRYEKKLKRWENTFMCTSCGTLMEIDEA